MARRPTPNREDSDEQTKVHWSEVPEPATPSRRLSQGDPIGRYVALRPVGRGGMGVVWAAWDPELDREVAIKLVRQRDASELARGRLIREAQAMARLSHPNIVAVHDVGQVERGVFVAMDFVRGETLREWCKAARPWREVLGVFVQAARGLAAAHEAGLIHRDFKPDNAMIDGQGRVRVMDFGLAAAHGDEGEGEGESPGAGAAAGAATPAEHRRRVSVGDSGDSGDSRDSRDSSASLSRRARAFVLESADSGDSLASRSWGGRRELSTDLLSTPLTEAGAIMGTPAYMAPEQLRGQRGGPAADQFALCVALWEGLFGERPFAGKGLEELSTTVLAGTLRRPPKDRRVPSRIRRILERGLCVDAGARWPSIAGLADKLESAQRRRGSGLAFAGLGTAAVAVALLRPTAAEQTEKACEARHGEGRSFAELWSAPRQAAVEAALVGAGSHGPQAWSLSQAGLEGWIEGWSAVSLGACLEGDGLPAELRVEQAVCLEDGREEFAATVELLAEADAELAARAHDLVEGLPEPSRCADPRVLAARGALEGWGEEGARSSEDEDAASIIEDSLRRAEVTRRAGRHRETLDALAALEPAVRDLDRAPLLGRWLAALGRERHSMGEHGEAIPILTEAYGILLGVGDDERAATLAVELMRVHGTRLAQTEAGRAWDLHARALIERSRGGAELRVDRLVALAMIADSAGEYRVAIAGFEAAEALHRESGLEPDQRLASLLTELGASHSRLGELEAAAALESRALAILSNELGPAHPKLGEVHFKIGNTCYRAGDLDGAREHFAQAIALVEASLDPAHPVVTASLVGLGAVQLSSGETEGARDTFQRAVERIEAREGVSHPGLAPPLVNLGLVLTRLERFEEAEAAETRALAILEEHRGAHHPDLLAVLDNLGELKVLAQDPAGAKAYYRRSLAIGEETFGAEHPELDYALLGLGDAALAEAATEDGERGRALDEAEGYFARVVAHTAHEGQAPANLGAGHFGLAQVHGVRGELRLGREQAEAALAVLKGLEHPSKEAIAEIEAWLLVYSGG